MVKLGIFIWLTVCLAGSDLFGQVDSITRKSRYFSLAVEGFMPTSTKISPNGNRKTLKYNRIPGVSFGVNYTSVSERGFTVLAGLHYRMLPISYKFVISPRDYEGPSEWQQNIHGNLGNLSFGHFFIPFQVGYTLRSINQKWEPSFSGGINLTHLPPYSLDYTTTIGDNGERYPLFAFSLVSPDNNDRLWTSFSFNAKLKRILKNGKRAYLGITSNFSSTNVYNGLYTFYYKDQAESGSYLDRGSYLGMQFGYSL